MQKKAAIDLGAANLLASAGGEIVMCEPSAIALDRATEQVLYYGEDAEKMLVAPPQNIVLLRPFRAGVTADMEFAKKILSGTVAAHFPGASHLALSVPCSAGELEECALAEIVAQCGVRYPHVVYSPIAALAGSETGISGQALVVDMGATATNIALICDGEIIYMRSIPIAGEAYDRAICTYLLRERGVKVSLRTAEAIKITIGSVWSDGSGGEMQVSARREGEVDPLTVTIRGEEMYRALEEPTASILEAICVAISHIPTQYVHEVFAHGIILSGGTAMLDGLDRMISGVTGVKTVKAKSPVGAVCLGLDRILSTLGDRSIASVRNLSGLYLSKCRAHGA